MNSDTNKEPYIGSVRFYKNLILLVVLLMIIIPTIVSTVQFFSIKKLKKDIENLNEIKGIEIVEQKEVSSNSTETTPLPYQELYPDMYIHRDINFKAIDYKACYLTFDDGPSDVTPLILDTLSEYEAKATFFVVGLQIDGQQNIDILNRILDEGHAIGVHTYTHEYDKIYSSVEAYLEDFYKAWEAIYNATGKKVDIYRFPGGSINGHNMEIYPEIIAEMTRRGFVYYDWNTSSGDANSQTLLPETIYQNVATGLNYNEAIILMHDSYSKRSTYEALPNIIKYYKDNGYKIEKITSDVNPSDFAYK